MSNEDSKYLEDIKEIKESMKSIDNAIRGVLGDGENLGILNRLAKLETKVSWATRLCIINVSSIIGVAIKLLWQ